MNITKEDTLELLVGNTRWIFYCEDQLPKKPS
nr:MAG TPA: hypothetical protein [Caudoviricetes sp.]